jgi:hypothetical protein
VDVGTCSGCLDLFFVGDKLLFRGEFELHILRLRRPAILTSFRGAFIARIAIGTGPFILNVPESSSGWHNACSFSFAQEAIIKDDF